MVKSALIRSKKAVSEVLPNALKTCWWLIKVTVLVSVGISILRYFNILPWFSGLIGPLFSLMGLPGEAALAYVTGYFVNVYSAIAVIVTLNLDVRAITILSVMVLCSHNMITETAVQKKTGSSAVRMVIVRTLSAFILGLVLNRIMPGEPVKQVMNTLSEALSLEQLFTEWLHSTVKIVIKMSLLIISLSVLQRILAEFGVIKWISKFFKPLLYIFGLPAKTSFLWIVANILGLAYGAAVMIDEYNRGKVGKEEIDLLNHHTGVSHSNLEDLLLLTSVGGLFLWMLLSRWLMSMLLVWELRIEMTIRKKYLPLSVN
ncbi:MAG: nucleoside recognition domain-containing protein [Bacteroidales bacterium]|nr:nucleoside recognition domain-containing protein [Bacteroidales bacterium]MDD3988838.1 nucleoside recognition domain-containing protein [Bacteroidales bacterium]MDD4639094.1 nucleoside recognition domain-containing protein [Bacteroidales bacterium]